jgi:SAM-dependent methyltransferase
MRGGEVTFDIATIVGQMGSVVGLDMDEVKLALARDVATRRRLSQVEFRRADVMTWTQPEAFDMVYARALLQHVTDPVDMLRRMWAGVRPGGVLIAEDTDFERAFCEPPNVGFDFFIRNYIALLTKRGGDANVGRRLFGYVRSLGVSDVNLSATLHPFSFGEKKALLLSTLEFSSAAMVAEGLATDAEVVAAYKSMSRHVDDPDTIHAGPALIQVWARKPAGS